MTVLVTGGAGYIGSHMVWRLLDDGYDVVVLDNLSTGFRDAIAPAATLVEGDVSDQNLVGALLRDYGVTGVIHFAGSVVVPESVADPLGYYRNNTIATHGLITACVETGVRNIIFSSTAAVYGTPEVIPVTEASPTLPESPYGHSKLMTEQMLRDVAATGRISFAALRYFNVAGADPAGRAGQSTRGATHLIKTACEVAAGKRNEMQIFGTDYDTHDGTCIRDYIHVSDLVDAHVLALESLAAGGPSLLANCGYGHGYSVREVIEAVEKASGCALPVKETGRRPGDAVAVVADPSRVKRILGWSPQYDDLNKIVEGALRWESRRPRTE